ncbi:MAG: glycosyltransferase family 39 protein [Phycisphaerae bacterium]|nr:glycosyltransferase family 39 protein [Phycisphaerae bacterium]MCZ2399671.1 glycosyltransferase family 39 protein [Phycisphaerae bacterium]
MSHSLDRLARRFRPRRVLLALLVCGVLWRLARFAVGFPFWGDEAFVGVNFLVRDFAGMFRPLEWGQIVPLGSLWANLAVVRVLGVNEWSLRLVQTAASLATLLLFWRFAVRVAPRRAAVLATGIFAASYFLVRHGAEIKPYATDALVSLALTLLGWAVYTRPQSAPRWTALVVFAAAAVWCSYPAVFVAGAVGMLLALAAIRPGARAAALAWCAAYGVVLAASFATMYAAFARPAAEAAARIVDTGMWKPTFPPLEDPLRIPLWLVAMHTGRMLAYPVGGEAPGSAGTLALVIVGAAVLALRNAPLLLLLLGPLPLALVAAALEKYPYGGSVRTMIYMAPAFCLLAGLGAWWLILRAARLLKRPAGAARHAFNGLAIVLCAGMLAGAAADVARPYQSRVERDGRAAIVRLARDSRPADRWVVFNAVTPVDYAPWLGDWRGTGGQFVFDVARLAPVPLAWAPPPDDIVVAGGGRLWLLAYRGVRVEFPEAQFAAYCAAIERRFEPAGEPRRTLLKQREGRIEAIDIQGYVPRGVPAAPPP